MYLSSGGVGFGKTIIGGERDIWILWIRTLPNRGLVYLLSKKYNSAPSSQNNHISDDNEPILDNEEDPILFQMNSELQYVPGQVSDHF